MTTRTSLSTEECSQLYLKDWENTSILQCDNCQLQAGDGEAPKLSRCSACKAVVYCSTKCQTDEWNGRNQSSLRKKWDINPHKRKCPWYKRAMEPWPEVAAIQQLFPWSANAMSLRQMPQIHNRIELILGLKGESAENGYWREPAAVEEAPELLTLPTCSEAYICHGSMLLEPVLPPHVEAWKLPIHHIPHIQFETPRIEIAHACSARQ
ncbi:Zinc finger MYND domain-containing protein 15 [Mycena sanguinolenta]|uniref:Zinc finger MYND domain-containing protein 15 n=1 Tax=Mycena sanguinolenta TaxID=230812 RepID=A0A8H6YHR5_9AGAR|nr:Zinc finger MYND domain-containing protein 15 [Mycena sanguinolenta]